MSAQTNTFSNSINSYSFDLYQETKIENQNLFLSPLSTYVSLLMVYEGAKKRTKKELKDVLYLKKSSFSDKNTINYNTDKKDSSGFHMVNSIWLDHSFLVNEKYKTCMSEQYSVKFRQREFSDVQASFLAINGWVSKQTGQLIKEIVSTSDINSNTKLLLVNAVHFKGEWLSKFDMTKTNEGVFYSNAENQFNVDLMHKKELLQYYETNEYQFVSKPYKSSNISLGIVLPKQLFGIKGIEEKLNNNFFNKLLDKASEKETALSMPKLKFESSVKLKGVLRKMGIKSAFSNEADFSGITTEVPLVLGNVLHKACIELNEDKTEAAAATTIGFNIRGTSQSPYKIFTADHPFVFFVFNKHTREILFMGRYVTPLNVAKITNSESLEKNIANRKNIRYAVGKESEPLIFLGKKQITSAKLGKMKPDDIESFQIYKKKETIQKFTSKNCNGIIVVRLKKRRDRKK